LRENWLNPLDLVRRAKEVVPGYPDRILPVDVKAAAILKTRTLTNLYNERPVWLDNAHRSHAGVKVEITYDTNHIIDRLQLIAGNIMRHLLGWRRVLSAWALVAVLVAGGFAVLELAPSFGLAESSPELRGARIPQGTRIPQYDPFDVGPPLFENADGGWDADGDGIIEER
jgi:hypothetical protein